MSSNAIKQVVWIGSSRSDLAEFPEVIKDRIGFALYSAQQGRKHPDAKPLIGFGGSGVLEIVVNNMGNTYRSVYTVKFSGRVFVLHSFQKKSKSGIATPKAEIDLINARLKRAAQEHLRWTTRLK